MERLGGRDRILTGHRVDDEERVVRLDRLGDATDLVHHLVVDREPARGVDDDDVTSDAPRLVDALASRVDGIAGLAEHGHVDLPAERAQLVDRGGPLQVGADEERVATLLLEPACELAGVRRLT